VITRVKQKAMKKVSSSAVKSFAAITCILLNCVDTQQYTLLCRNCVADVVNIQKLRKSCEGVFDRAQNENS
jgi:hypothetical protein